MKRDKVRSKREIQWHEIGNVGKGTQEVVLFERERERDLGEKKAS